MTVPAGTRTRAVRLFDWLSAGSIVEVSRGSTLTLVFSSGARYELGETARVRAGETSLASSSGPVRRLEPVPPLPHVSPIAEGARAGSRSGAVRIRGATIGGMYPAAASATLAEQTVLRFTVLPDASRYRVDVETETGARVFQIETHSATVNVSPGVLQRGARYYWQVRTLDRIGQVARGVAEFVTLSAEIAASRAALKEALESAGDASSLALLAEVDRRLGLLVEARDAFRAAVANSPGDAALRHALDRLERQLAAVREKSEE